MNTCPKCNREWEMDESKCSCGYQISSNELSAHDIANDVDNTEAAKSISMAGQFIYGILIPLLSYWSIAFMLIAESYFSNPFARSQLMKELLSIVVIPSFCIQLFCVLLFPAKNWKGCISKGYGYVLLSILLACLVSMLICNAELRGLH